jgi:hypothetical protein
MNSELVDIIENDKEIPEEYIVKTDEEIRKEIEEKKENEQKNKKSFLQKLFGK